MKRRFILKLAFLFGSIWMPSLTSYLQAQTDSVVVFTPPKDMSYEVVKMNPAALLVGPTVVSTETGLSYEFSLSKNKSLSLGASLLSKNVFIYLAEKLNSDSNSVGNVVQISPKLKISGFRVQAQYKYLLSFYDYPCGLYIGPHVSFSTVYFSYQQRGFTNDFYKIVHNNLSLLIGYQHILSNRLFIDLYCGLGYKYNYMIYYKTLDDFEKVDNEFIFTGIPGNVKISLGYYLGYKF